jgi:cation channel sperm-associated protein 2
LLYRILKDNPSQVIKFKVFKRSLESRVNNDVRMARVRNKETVPVGVYAHWLTNHKVFSWGIIAVILINAAILGIQPELDAREWYRLLDIFQIIDWISLVIYVIEIMLKWIDSFRSYWKSGWNWFDFIITVASAGAEVLLVAFRMPAASLLVNDNTRSFFLVSPAYVVQMVGYSAKVLRTLRALKMIVHFRSLRVIVRTILDAFQSMIFIMILLTIVTYIYAVFGINLFESYTESREPGLQYQEKFSNMYQAFITLFQLLTLDQWFSIEQEIATIVNPIFTAVYFVSWVWIGAFIFRNVFVGVMVKFFENISQELNRREKEMREKARSEKQQKKLDKELKRKEAGRTKFVCGTDILRSALDHQESNRSLARSQSFSQTHSVMESNREEARQWEETVRNVLPTLATAKTETLWPRDTLFRYFQTMETLQENMQEYHELQWMAAWALYNCTDAS